MYHDPSRVDLRQLIDQPQFVELWYCSLVISVKHWPSVQDQHQQTSWTHAWIIRLSRDIKKLYCWPIWVYLLGNVSVQIFARQLLNMDEGKHSLMLHHMRYFSHRTSVNFNHQLKNLEKGFSWISSTDSGIMFGLGRNLTLLQRMMTLIESIIKFNWKVLMRLPNTKWWENRSGCQLESRISQSTEKKAWISLKM